MTESQKAELVRESILLDLNAASPSTLPATTLGTGARRNYGIPVTDTEITSHITRLVAQAFVEEQRSAISAGVVRYRITDAGVKYLIEAALA
ncbi:hypothetical protein ACWPKS_15895 [Coraliomargarita sp. W4R72]